MTFDEILMLQSFNPPVLVTLKTFDPTSFLRTAVGKIEGGGFQLYCRYKISDRVDGIRLTLSWRRSLSYRNQSIDLRSKSMEWFLYDNGLCHERVNLE